MGIVPQGIQELLPAWKGFREGKMKEKYNWSLFFFFELHIAFQWKLFVFSFLFVCLTGLSVEKYLIRD